VKSSEWKSISELRGVACYMGSHLPPDTSEHTLALTPASEGRYSIYLPQRDGRLSWPMWLVTYRDGLPRPPSAEGHPSKC